MGPSTPDPIAQGRCRNTYFCCGLSPVCEELLVGSGDVGEEEDKLSSTKGQPCILREGSEGLPGHQASSRV